MNNNPLIRKAKAEKVERKDYMVLANFMSRTISPLDPGKYLKLMGTYKATSPKEAFRMFLEEYAQDLKTAQRFYDDIRVVPISGDPEVFTLSSIFGGKLFPNPAVMNETDDLFL